MSEVQEPRTVSDALQTPQPGDDDFDPTMPEPGTPEFDAWVTEREQAKATALEEIRRDQNAEQGLDSPPPEQQQDEIVGYLITPNLAWELVGYLDQQPHGEVRHLIDGLRGAVAVPAQTAEDSALTDDGPGE